MEPLILTSIAAVRDWIREMLSAVNLNDDSRIDRIPTEHRRAHEMLYNLLADVPTAATFRAGSGLLLMGVGGGSREDPLFGALKQILPDVSDAEHIFQAAKNNVEVFVTSDERTIIRFASEISTASGVKVLSPTEFAETMDKGNA